MKIEHETPFPTMGEAVQTFYRWSGLWNFYTVKHGSSSVTPQKVRTFQKELDRFAHEEVLMSFGRIEDGLYDAISNVLKDEFLSRFAAKSAILCLSGYIKEVRDNATWQDREATCRWFMTFRAVPPLVLSAQKIAFLVNRKEVEDAVLLPDEPWWFLPSKTEKGVWVTPIQKVITWWMDKNGFETAEALEKKVNNRGRFLSAVTIRAWINGTTVPEISTLLVLRNEVLGLGPEEEKSKRSLLALIILARVIKNLFDAVRRILADGDIESLIADFKTLYLAYEKNERVAFEKRLPILLATLGVNEQYASADDLLKCDRRYREDELLPKFLGLMQEVTRRGTSDFVVGKDFGSELVRLIWRRNCAEEVPPVVYTLGDMIRIVNETRREKRLCVPVSPIERLQESGKKLDPDVNTLYMTVAVDARLAVCAGDCERAFGLYVRAFQEARYRGGRLVEEICEELMALCCFRYSMAIEHKAPRGSNWIVARYVRDWCALMDICHDVWGLDDEAFVKWGCRVFEQLMRAPEVG